MCSDTSNLLEVLIPVFQEFTSSFGLSASTSAFFFLYIQRSTKRLTNPKHISESVFLILLVKKAWLIDAVSRKNIIHCLEIRLKYGFKWLQVILNLSFHILLSTCARAGGWTEKGGRGNGMLFLYSLFYPAVGWCMTLHLLYQLQKLQEYKSVAWDNENLESLWHKWSCKKMGW